MCVYVCVMMEEEMAFGKPKVKISWDKIYINDKIK